MAGFAIECFLKALILERHPNLQTCFDPAQLSVSDQEVYNALYRHELDELLGFIPELELKLSLVKLPSGQAVWRPFLQLCAEWTIFVRYSSKSASIDEARRYIETISEVQKWLKQ